MLVFFHFSPDVYHVTFDWPSSPDVAGRLKEATGTSEEEIVKRLVHYHRHVDGILQCYDKGFKKFNADQPKSDVFAQGMYPYLL